VESVLAFDFSGASQRETLFSPGVGFHFRHDSKN